MLTWGREAGRAGTGSNYSGFGLSRALGFGLGSGSGFAKFSLSRRAYEIMLVMRLIYRKICGTLAKKPADFGAYQARALSGLGLT